MASATNTTRRFVTPGAPRKNGRGECREECIVLSSIVRLVWASVPSSDFSNVGVNRGSNTWSSRPARFEKPPSPNIHRRGPRNKSVAELPSTETPNQPEKNFSTRPNFLRVFLPARVAATSRHHPSRASRSLNRFEPAKKEEAACSFRHERNWTHRRCRPRAACRTPRC